MPARSGAYLESLGITRGANGRRFARRFVRANDSCVESMTCDLFHRRDRDCCRPYAGCGKRARSRESPTRETSRHRATYPRRARSCIRRKACDSVGTDNAGLSGAHPNSDAHGALTVHDAVGPANGEPVNGWRSRAKARRKHPCSTGAHQRRCGDAGQANTDGTTACRWPHVVCNSHHRCERGVGPCERGRCGFRRGRSWHRVGGRARRSYARFLPVAARNGAALRRVVRSGTRARRREG